MVLIAGYDFKGDAKDFSGNNNDGTVSGATLTTNQFGMANSAYDLTGGNHFITIPHHASLNLVNFTYSFWAYAVSTANSYICSKRVTTNGWYIYVGSDDSMEAYTVTASGNAAATAPAGTFTNGVWHHVVYTYDGATQKLYVDNVLVGSTSSGTGNAQTNTVDVLIGQRSGAGYWNGYISNALFLSHVLTADEVKTLYDLTKQKFIYPFPEQREGGITQ